MLEWRYIAQDDFLSLTAFLAFVDHKEKIDTKSVQIVSTQKLYLELKKRKMNETLIFIKIVLLAFLAYRVFTQYEKKIFRSV